MKIIISGILALMTIFNLGYANDNSFISMPKAEQLDKVLQTNVIPTMSDLAHIENRLSPKLRKSNRTVVIQPGHTRLVYFDNCIILYSYYRTNYSATILEGNNCGIQAFYDYDNFIIDGSRRWSYVTVDGKLMMRHKYSDSKVYTDYESQMVIFD